MNKLTIFDYPYTYVTLYFIIEAILIKSVL